MIYGWLADLTVLIHLGFVVFVVAGGFLVWVRPYFALVHLPAVGWAVWIEFTGDICPLTHLEIHWRTMAGGGTYQGDFVQHYIIPLLYPVGLTPQIQFVLGGLALVLNLGVYGWLLVHRMKKRKVKTF